jgi:hypothetical protein
MSGNTTRVPASACPFCGHVHNALTGARETDDVPTAEDSVTVCISCASILFLDDDLRVRAPRPGEIEGLKNQGDDIYDTLLAMQRAIRSVDRR